MTSSESDRRLSPVRGRAAATAVPTYRLCAPTASSPSAVPWPPWPRSFPAAPSQRAPSRSASPRQSPRVPPPPSEPVAHVFPRTPAFAWAPTRGALCYEFELATSRRFGENAIVWSNVRYGVKPGGGCKAVDTAPSTVTTPGSARPRRTRRTPGIDGHQARAGSTARPRDHGLGDRPGRPDRDPAAPRSGRLGRRRAPVVHGPAVRDLRPRPRDHDEGPDGVEPAVRLQHALAERADAAPDPARPRPLGAASAARPATRSGTRTSRRSSRCTRTSPTCASSTPLHRLVHDREVARSGGASRLRHVPNGLPVVSYGPWSPTYTASNPA